MNIAVYCSSSNNIDDKYFTDAKLLGKVIAEKGHTLLYGGTFMGLMGAVAQSNAEYGGKRIGFISSKIYDIEDVAIDDGDLINVETLGMRKAKMAELADMHIVLPGGFGTLDEALSILAMKQVGESDTPVLFFNSNGFYDDFQKQLKKYYYEGFAPLSFQTSYKFVNTFKELNELLIQF